MAWDILSGAMRAAKVLGGSSDQVKPIKEESFQLTSRPVKTYDQSVPMRPIMSGPNVNQDDQNRRASIPGYTQTDPDKLQSGDIDSQINELQHKIDALNQLKQSGITSFKAGKMNQHSKRGKERVVSTDPKTGRDMIVD